MYETINGICNDKRHSNAGVKDKQNNITTKESQRLERWKEHFEELLNRNPPEKPMEDTIIQTPVIESISTDPVSLEEVRLGIVSLRDGKVL